MKFIKFFCGIFRVFKQFSGVFSRVVGVVRGFRKGFSEGGG